MFPELLDAGVEGEQAFFDLEFIDGSLNAKEYLSSEGSVSEVTKLTGLILQAAEWMHSHETFKSYSGALQLYFAEEVRQRLRDALGHAPFREFCEQPEIIVDGLTCNSLLRNLGWLEEAFSGLTPPPECFTHGNMTLENILYVPDSGRLVFVDPYDENVIDCREAEYSQVLQCCSSHYGIINDGEVIADGASVSFLGQVPRSLTIFRDLFVENLEKRLTPSTLRLVRLLEASQFTRMLPFKVAAGHIDKAKYFFGVASSLVDRLRGEDDLH